MKNIHVLPTDKPSRLYFNINDREYQICENEKTSTVLKPNKHVYITSDEEIKEGDWYLINGFKNAKKITSTTEILIVKDVAKKIILTTDQDLIKDGVQSIGDEFLEWFVKNPSCESVEVSTYHVKGDISGKLHYKIIIPQEEPKQEFPQLATKEFNDLSSAYFGGNPKQECLFTPTQNTTSATICANCGNEKFLHTKQENDYTALLQQVGTKQETLEEVAERFYEDEVSINAFINSAKWQQEQDKNKYNEEDLKEAFYQGWVLSGSGVSFREAINKWFEQFKNK